MENWPTLSLKKKTADPPAPAPADPVDIAPETQPKPTQVEESNQGSPQSENASAPQKTKGRTARKRFRAKEKLRDRWYPRLLNGDLQYIAPVLSMTAPLAVGVHKAMTQRLTQRLMDDGPIQHGLGGRITRAVLGFHVQQPAYLRACIENPMRHDLDGHPTEPLSASHQNHARKRLEKIEAQEQKQITAPPQ